MPTNVVTTLLDFILDLLRDPSAAQDFNADPHAALASAGLSDVGPADVNAVMPMLADCSTVRDWSGGSSGGGHHPRPVDHSDDEPAHQPPPPADDSDHGHEPPYPGHGGDHEQDGHEQDGHEYAVIQHLQYIQNTYSITEIDASHSVWVGGDVNVLFGDDNVLATNGAVALGEGGLPGDISVDNSSTDVDVRVDDSFNGSFNDVDGDGNAIGTDNEVDNSSTTTTTTMTTTTTITDSGNTGSYDDTLGGDVNTAGGDVNTGTQTTIGDIEVKDNNVAVNGGQIADDGGQAADDGGQNADDGGTTIDDSFDPTDSFDHTDTDVEVHVDDVNVVDDSDGAVVGNDLAVEDSFDDNQFAGEDIDQSQDHLSDNFSENDLSTELTDAG
jgi:hypothetical protein